MAKYANIFVEKGMSFSEEIDLKNDDGSEFGITSYSAIGKARKHVESETAISFDIAKNLVTNNITFSLTPEATSALSVCNYIYDIVLINNITGEKLKLVEGTMIVSGTASL